MPEISTKDYQISLSVVGPASVSLMESGTITADGSLVTITLTPIVLLDSIRTLGFGSDPDFGLPDAWEKVVITLSPAVNDQFKSLVFRKDNSIWACKSSWNSHQYIGSWEIENAYIVSLTGRYLKLPGNFSDNLVVS